MRAKTEARLARFRVPENRKLVEAHLKAMKTDGARESTRDMVARALAYLDAHLNKPFTEATREDLEAYLADMTIAGGPYKGQPVKEATRILNKVVIKTFYRHRLPDLFPKVAAWINGGYTGKERVADDILTPEEIRKLVENATTQRDQALLAALYDGGMRIGEFLALRVGDIRFHEDGSADLVLPKDAPGLKTGRRVVPIVESVPYLQRWLEVHPLRKEPKAPLWPPLLSGEPTKAITRRSLVDSLRTVARRAGITKAVNPHAFRHARATECARKGWTEAQMRNFFGWARSSPMPSLYIHLADADVRNRVLQDAGVRARPKPEDSPLKPVTCWNPLCGQINAPTAAYCAKCGRPLSVERVREVRRREAILARDHEEAMVSGEMQKLLDDPQVQKLLRLVKGLEGTGATVAPSP